MTRYKFYDGAPWLIKLPEASWGKRATSQLEFNEKVPISRPQMAKRWSEPAWGVAVHMPRLAGVFPPGLTWWREEEEQAVVVMSEPWQFSQSSLQCSQDTTLQRKLYLLFQRQRDRDRQPEISQLLLYSSNAHHAWGKPRTQSRSSCGWQGPDY